MKQPVQFDPDYVPPRLPPWLLTWRCGRLLFLNVLAVAMNLYMVHVNIIGGKDGWAFFNATGAAMSIYACFLFVRMVLRDVARWRHLRAGYLKTRAEILELTKAADDNGK